MISPASKSEGCPAVVTQFRSGKNDQLPAPTTGGLYKTNRRQRGRSCRGLSAPRFSGRRGHVSFETESSPAGQIRCVEERTSVRCARARGQKGVNTNAKTKIHAESCSSECCHRCIPAPGAGTETHLQSLLGDVYPQERVGCLYEEGD